MSQQAEGQALQVGAVGAEQGFWPLGLKLSEQIQPQLWGGVGAQRGARLQVTMTWVVQEDMAALFEAVHLSRMLWLSRCPRLDWTELRAT